MKFTIEQSAEAIVILSIAEKTMGNQNQKKLFKAVEKSIEKGNANFVINLEKVNMISSRGLNLLLTILTLARNAGGDVVLANISEQLNNLLIITKLTAIFTAKDTVVEAVGELSAFV